MSAKTNGERLLELARDLSCGLMEADEQRELGRLLYDAALWTGNPLRKLSPVGALCDTHAVDLERLRSLARSWIVEAGGTVADTKHACADELLALIDGQAVVK